MVRSKFFPFLYYVFTLIFYLRFCNVLYVLFEKRATTTTNNDHLFAKTKKDLQEQNKVARSGKKNYSE